MVKEKNKSRPYTSQIITIQNHPPPLRLLANTKEQQRHKQDWNKHVYFCFCTKEEIWGLLIWWWDRVQQH